jgi:hypothetical protein
MMKDRYLTIFGQPKRREIDERSRPGLTDAVCAVDCELIDAAMLEFGESR